MDRDPVRFWRSTFVVFGGLLALWSVIASLYVAFLRVPARTAGDDPKLACAFGEVMMDGACTDMSWLGILLAALGTGIVVAGLALFRPVSRRAEDLLRTGPGTRFSLALLTSLVFVPASFALMSAGRAGTPQEEWVRFGPTAYGAAPMLWAAAGLAMIALAAALAVHVAHESRKRHYLHLLRVHEARSQEPPGGHGLPGAPPATSHAPQPPRRQAAPWGQAVATRAAPWTASQPSAPRAYAAPAAVPPAHGAPVAAPTSHDPPAVNHHVTVTHSTDGGRLPNGGFRWESV